jgi:hypothetical protein
VQRLHPARRRGHPADGVRAHVRDRRGALQDNRALYCRPGDLLPAGKSGYEM